MSVLDVFIVLQYLGANAWWSILKWHSYTASRDRLQNDSEPESEILLRIYFLGKLTGGLLLINLWLLFLPVPRSSALQQLLGSDHAQLLRYHRWLGHASLLLGSLHGGLFYAYWLAQGRFWRQVLDWCGEASVNHLAGSLALLSCATIWLTSLPAIRRANFPVFRKCHGAGFLGYVAFLGFHWPRAYAYALPGLILLAIDAACSALAQKQADHRPASWEAGPGWVSGERDPAVAALYFPALVPPFTNSRPRASRALSEAETGSGKFFSAESGSTSAALSTGSGSIPDSLLPSSSPSSSLLSQEFLRSEDLAEASSLDGGCPLRHVMLLVPSLAPREWHPFCASFVPGHLRVIVQRQGRWTAALLRALASGQLPTAKISLPTAPACEDWAGANRVLLVGGGLAAVALGPVLETIAALWRARPGSDPAAAEPSYAEPPYVSLVWAVREREELGALDSHLEAIMDMEEELTGGQAPEYWPRWLQVQVFLTRGASDGAIETSPQASPGGNPRTEASMFKAKVLHRVEGFPNSLVLATHNTKPWVVAAGLGLSALGGMGGVLATWTLSSLWLTANKSRPGAPSSDSLQAELGGWTARQWDSFLGFLAVIVGLLGATLAPLLVLAPYDARRRRAIMQAVGNGANSSPSRIMACVDLAPDSPSPHRQSSVSPFSPACVLPPWPIEPGRPDLDACIRAALRPDPHSAEVTRLCILAAGGETLNRAVHVAAAQCDKRRTSIVCRCLTPNL